MDPFTAQHLVESVDFGSLPENDRTCAIYYTTEEPEGPLRLAGCGHVFGEKCIEKWSAHGGTCPLCRAPLRPSQRGSAASSETHEESPNFSAQAATLQPPLQFSQPPVIAPQAYGLQTHAFPSNNAHVHQPNGYVQPLSVFWPAPQPNQQLAAAFLFPSTHQMVAVDLQRGLHAEQTRIPRTAAAAPQSQHAHPWFQPHPAPQPHVAIPPYPAPAQHTGLRFGGRSALAASMTPQHRPSFPLGRILPRYSLFSQVPYDHQPQQAQGAGPRPNNQP